MHSFHSQSAAAPCPRGRGGAVGRHCRAAADAAARGQRERQGARPPGAARRRAAAHLKLALRAGPETALARPGAEHELHGGGGFVGGEGGEGRAGWGAWRRRARRGSCGGAAAARRMEKKWRDSTNVELNRAQQLVLAAQAEVEGRSASGSTPPRARCRGVSARSSAASPEARGGGGGGGRRRGEQGERPSPASAGRALADDRGAEDRPPHLHTPCGSPTCWLRRAARAAAGSKATVTMLVGKGES